MKSCPPRVQPFEGTSREQALTENNGTQRQRSAVTFPGFAANGNQRQPMEKIRRHLTSRKSAVRARHRPSEESPAPAGFSIRHRGLNTSTFGPGANASANTRGCLLKNC